VNNYTRTRRTRRAAAPDLDRILIVGGGRAGLAAAEEVRELGFAGELVLLSEESDLPYDRPACSKGILNGRQRPSDVTLPVRDGTDISWRLGRRAVHLDPANRYLYTDTDEEFLYDGLVIATGSRPALPHHWPTDEPGFHVLYGLSGAWALRQELRAARKVAIIGGGLSGCETACAIRSMARDCVLIDSNRGVMNRAIGALASEYVTEEVARDGVELRLGRRVHQVERGRRGWVVTLDDGSEVVADIVVATLGEKPDTGWLESGTRWDLSDGILCDQSLRVVGAEGVVAAGTIARWPNARFDSAPARCGQWIAALEHGQAAARALLAGDQPVAPAAVLPRYWSDQFGLRIQVVGQLPTDSEVTVTQLRPNRRDVARSGLLVSYTDHGILVGMVAVNAPHAFTAITRAMIASPNAVETTDSVRAAWRHLTAVA
jgi:NADPH-dependent 2,4-dienoyl-CoA reductase/sulfur reductase-like enzyme